MLKNLLIVICMFSGYVASSQSYISLAPSLTNSAGTISDKSNLAVEFGQQWDVFSMGLDVGNTTLSKLTQRDTSVHIELRPHLNIFQQGKFTNPSTAGTG